MSVVSSYFSSRSTAFGINAQVASLMDSIFAIAAGLAVRFVIDVVSHHDVKLTGTLVGLWEGVVMQHFLRKMPASFDPYVAYGVRLFIDFLFTESVPRMVLVLVWTGMGIILADVAPALWVDVGMRRIWRRFRRDLYVMTQSVPSVPSFTRPRIVRFSPSRTASVVSTTPPSVFTTATQDPTRLSPPTPGPRKRAVPGAFPGDVSETETDISQRSETSTSIGTVNHRFSSFRRYQPTFDTETEISSGFNDLDEGNVSSSDSSCSTQTADPSAVNPSEIPDYEEEEERVALKDKGKGREEDKDTTPKAREIVLPPTPSESALALHPLHDEPEEVQPPVAEVPNIPDQPDDDWENISRREAAPTPPPGQSEDTPPTPPAKDDLAFVKTLSPPPQQVPPPIDSQPAEPIPARKSEEVAPALTESFSDLVDLGTEVLPASQQTEPPAAPSQQNPEPPAVSSQLNPEPPAAPSQQTPEPPAASSQRNPKPPAASSQQNSEPAADPTGEPANSAHWDDIFHTRNSMWTPPPTFQDIYDQAQPGSKRASLLKTDVETTNTAEQPNPDNNATATANDEAGHTNNNEIEPTKEATATNEQNEPAVTATADAVSQQQEQETSAPEATETQAQADVSEPPAAESSTPPPPSPSIASSTFPTSTSERLKKAIELRRQTIELHSEMKDGADIASIKAAEKKLKKLNEKASKRYLAGAFS